MLSLGPLSFALPIALMAVLALPVIWWVLRLTPPQPKQIWFPPFRLLAGLATEEQSAQITPPWLLLLRLLLALFVILSVSHPLLYPDRSLTGHGPVYIIVDDGWASSDSWALQKETLNSLIDQTERQNREIIIVRTTGANDTDDQKTETFSPDRAREVAESLRPNAWIGNPQAAINRIVSSGFDKANRPGDVIWLSNGITKDRKVFSDITAKLRSLGGVTILSPSGEKLPIIIRPPVSDGNQFRIPVERLISSGPQKIHIIGRSQNNTVVMSETVEFKKGENSAEAVIELPTELRNRMTRLEIEGRKSASSIFLLDGRWQRRPVGILSGDVPKGQPLLSPEYYIERALSPFSEVRRSKLSELLKRPLSIIILPDQYLLEEGDSPRLNKWMQDGGTVVRFAGPNLSQFAATDEEPLLPVALRQGDRIIGGSMSWRKPQRLAAFPNTSPYSGLKIPEDVTVKRQVLAKPSPDLGNRTWARLVDGTPLITAAKQGDGWLVLFHTTANSEWSNFALSGLFVDILKRTTEVGKAVGKNYSRRQLPPLKTLSGTGQLVTPPVYVIAINTDHINTLKPSRQFPPGYYGDQEHRLAFNLSTTLPRQYQISDLPSGISHKHYTQSPELDFKPWLLFAALVLFFADLLISLGMRGQLSLNRNVAVWIGLLLFTLPEPVFANNEFDLKNSTESRLAYVITGDEETDVISLAGLRGLSFKLKQRTAIELSDPVGLNPEVDELAFFPMLYWPLMSTTTKASAQLANRINQYMAGGGIVVFDIRIPLQGRGSASALRNLAQSLKLPSLVQVPENHVLGRSFYLLNKFPGRWTGQAVWIERGKALVNDGVSSVIAGSHDWAGAWALDVFLEPILPVVPGGERQREMAYRFGINLLMYVMTGNYKEDQVHLPEIMKRLGQ